CQRVRLPPRDSRPELFPDPTARMWNRTSLRMRSGRPLLQRAVLPRWLLRQAAVRRRLIAVCRWSLARSNGDGPEPPPVRTSAGRVLLKHSSGMPPLLEESPSDNGAYQLI